MRDGVSGGQSAFVKQEVRDMRTRLCRLFWISALLLAPSVAQAQQTQTYEVPPVPYTGPLSHPRYEQGGFFTSLEGLYWRTNRPLASQQVAVRGFVDVDG